MAGAAARHHTGGMPTRNVYLVEDSPLVSERLLEMLESVPGVRVTGRAAGADEAIREILAARPDVVVLDIRLAQGSGFDVLRTLHDRAPEIEVYMLSGFATEPYRHLAARLGARGFFDKSTEFARVRDAVARPH
ncbi:MAG TPA: response regulator transcription factor [Burkholderiales bacterium]|nr:response regulator transcription factor [Burkholderiales bacterium]